ncbi:FAD-binding protein [Actinosynnema pretiosum subsp. pretiosum]|uniref:FAD-binding protein n=1 Tax=Actinosynnema pretiosum subsp. pretiosum TaxID=103721 RepID=A0AA45L823_9PSEU|nr:Oxidoreductase, FAD-binding protein [Actinosynnema pretiosum subsp. pretiosum]QUF05339.1 FAD-binding protein [Actinosynnema pretiosum subsp. pretiosum]
MDDVHPQPGRAPVTLSTSEEDLVWASRDFGGVISRRPRAVLRPTSFEEIRTALLDGLVLTPRGQGHSTRGQAQSEGGIVLDMTGFDTVHQVEDDRLVVDAGARWDQVLDAALRHDRTPPVLTDYLGLSVGGTLSAGGLGGASHQHGAQTDTVLELDVLTPNGTRTTCSPTHERALFDAVRAGRGDSGIILRATLRLIPTPAFTRTHALTYPRLDTYLHDQRRLATDGRFEHLEGRACPIPTGWSYRIEATSHLDTAEHRTDHLLHDLVFDEPAEITTLPYRDFADRMAPDVTLLRALGSWQQPHPWVNLLLPDEATEQLVIDNVMRLTHTDLGDGLILLYPLRRDLITTPRLAIPDSPLVFLCAVLGTATESTALGMTVKTAHLRAAARAAGGTVYLEDRNPLP